jgi:hypothetical protein
VFKKIVYLILYSLIVIILTIECKKLYDRLFTITEVRSNQVIKPIVDIRGNDTTYIYRNYIK